MPIIPFHELTEKCTFSLSLDQVMYNFSFLSAPGIFCRTFEDIAFYAFPPPHAFFFIISWNSTAYYIFNQSINLLGIPILSPRSFLHLLL